jgi:hypothetical protein
MPRAQRPHYHACDDCGTKTECSGTYEQNYDGWPEVVCSEVDVLGTEVVCDDCAITRQRQADADAAADERDDEATGGA